MTIRYSTRNTFAGHGTRASRRAGEVLTIQARFPFTRPGTPLRAALSLLIILPLLVAAPLRVVTAAESSSQDGTASAAIPAAKVVRRSQTPSLTLSLETSSPVVAVDTTISAALRAEVAAPVRELEVRFRIRRPNGKLLFQKTQTLSDVATGTVVVPYAKSIEDLSLRQGRYAIEVHVVAGRLPEVDLNDNVYVVKADAKPIPVVLVARVRAEPSFEPGGAFLTDPAKATRTRDRLDGLLRIMGRQPKMTAALAMPPILLDEWRQVAAGYETTGAAGHRTIPRNATATAEYTAVTSSLRTALGRGRLELADVPFAEPDLAGLQSIGALADLEAHHARASTIYQVSLATTPTAFTAIRGDSISSVTAPYLVKLGAAGVLLNPASVVTSVPVAPTGLYALRGTTLHALVLDDAGAQLLNAQAASADELLDHVLSRLVSETGPEQPVVLPVELDTGQPDDLARLEAFVARAASSGWIRFLLPTEALDLAPLTTADLKERPHPGPPAPKGYWDAVSSARRGADAFIRAVGDRDADADAAQWAALIAESRSWEGTGHDWKDASRGGTFAAASSARSKAVLSKLAISSEKVTLSGSEGKIPLTIRNNSGKTLSVTITASGRNATFPSGATVKTTLRPADNYVVVPVALGGGAMSDRLGFSVDSGSMSLASTVVEVRASYLDRIVLVATVAIVLLGLLVYIRRKVQRAEADKSDR